MEHDWRSDNMNGLAVVRISSHRQDGGISHETQEAEIRTYCKRHGIHLGEVCRIIESAKDSDQREKYTAAINKAFTHNYRHVLFYMFDREARNLTDTEKNEKLIKAGLLCLHYVRDSKVLHKHASDSDFFIRDVQAVTNKHYSRTLASKVTDAMKQKAGGGWYPSNHVPLGYVVARIKDDAGKLVARPIRDPVESNVKWVLREFELRAQGYSFDEIRKEIIAEKLLPEDRVRGYHKAAVEYRINNPFYEGKFTWQGHIYDGKHELIIPADLIKRARLGKRKPWAVKEQKGVFAGGWIRCAECGCNVVYAKHSKTYRNGQKATFHLYHCTNGKRAHESMKGRYVTEDALWQQFDAVLDRINLTPDMAKKIAAALNDAHKKSLASVVAEIERCKAIVAESEAKEDRACDQLDGGALDNEAFKRRLVRLRDERRQASSRLQELQSQIKANSKETVESTLELCKGAKKL